MAITLYENFVLENQISDLLNTKLDVINLMTVDNSLELEAGLKKVINKYTYSGTVEKLAKGAKNSTGVGSVSFVKKEYPVNRYQHTFKYNDMDVMQDGMVVDVATKGAAQVMANEIKTEYFAELAKISNANSVSKALTYEAVVDALAEIGCEAEEGSFLIMGSDCKADIRKDADYKASRQGEILYSGQFGSVAGVPCLFSKLVPANTCYITNKDAVKFFVKSAGSVEQGRDIETKENTVVYERHGVIALVDDTKSVKITVSRGA